MFKQNKQAFTLIELLVVVLIIGILAAVALPQYQVAVAKSRIMGYMPFIKSLAAAQEVHYLSNGQYTFNLQDLDVDAKNSCQPIDLVNWKNGEYNTVYCNENIIIDNYSANSDVVGIIKLKYCPSYASQGETKCSAHGDVRINFYLAHDKDYPNKIQCIGLTDFGKKICKTLPGMEVVE
ncbi:MAG: prepilin-type N-terminal cleavage/methylation domain-containing protein [Elusimicrobiaceae bacterium]|nr:prepilin-type N-terminal cleavage/methylation domain-containing protein [Elusimicrobiaceae bacterium]